MKKTNMWTIQDLSTVKTSEILVEARKLFPVWIPSFYENNIDTELSPPIESVEVSFAKNIESDPGHKGKSYDDFLSEKDKTYMTARQYLLLAIHVFKELGEHLDVKGWTRTSSLWSDGYLVHGSFRPTYREVCLSPGYRAYRNSDYGPREQLKLTLLTSSFNPSERSKAIMFDENALKSAIETVKGAGYKVIKEL